MSPLKLSFSEPRNGWVPATLRIGAKEFEFIASSVPNNPVEDLVNAVFDVVGNREATVWWHLEPGYYCFELTPEHAQLRVSVFFTEDSNGKERSEIATVSGGKQDILLALWRALRNFQSLRASETNWPEVKYGKLELLGEQLRAKRS